MPGKETHSQNRSANAGQHEFNSGVLFMGAGATQPQREAARKAIQQQIKALKIDVFAVADQVAARMAGDDRNTRRLLQLHCATWAARLAGATGVAAAQETARAEDPACQLLERLLHELLKPAPSEAAAAAAAAPSTAAAEAEAKEEALKLIMRGCRTGTRHETDWDELKGQLEGKGLLPEAAAALLEPDCCTQEELYRVAYNAARRGAPRRA
jgi:hypothetical protein